jgi:uncharacterized protein (DUF1697 family)
MTKYVALLRGVNVGGHNRLRMKDLCASMAGLGLGNVTTYKQSGNVIFESTDQDLDSLNQKIGAELKKLLGNEINMALRTIAQMRAIVKLDPFKHEKTGHHVCFISFLCAASAVKPRLPLATPNGDAEVFLIKKSELFSVARERNGRYGNPNKLLETKLKAALTTRNWLTIQALAAMD